MDFENVTLKDLSEIAAVIKDYAQSFKVWVFYGNVGAGKTTFIKEIVKVLGSNENVQSPTFSIVNEYGSNIYHFDLYRLKSLEEALDIGFEEYLDSDKYCLIEWPEIIIDLLPNEYLEIKIDIEPNNLRKIAVNKINNV